MLNLLLQIIYYVNKEDSSSHDIYFVKDAEQKSTPIGKGRGLDMDSQQ